MSEKKKPTPEEKLKVLRETLKEKEAEWTSRKLDIEKERDSRRLAAATKRYKATNKLKAEAKEERAKVKERFKVQEDMIQEEYQIEVDLCGEKRDGALEEVHIARGAELKAIDAHLGTQKALVTKEHEDDDKLIQEECDKKLHALEDEKVVLTAQIKRAAIQVAASTAKEKKPGDQATEGAQA